MALKPIQHHDEAEDEFQIAEPLCAVFRRHLKGLGQKYTPERAQILDTLIRIDDVFEAEGLQQALAEQGHRVSKATIYRTLKLLLESGIIQKVLHDSDQAHYQLAYGRRPRDVVIRLDTKEVIPVEAPELEAIRRRLCEELGLRCAGHRLQIYATGGDG